MESAALAAALAAVLTLFLGRAAIPRLRALRAQQAIREAVTRLLQELPASAAGPR